MRAIALFFALAGCVSALTIEEVVQLSEAGVADDTILEQMKADGSAFQLGAADLIDLHKKGVSPVVIRTMVSLRDRAALPADTGTEAPVPKRAPGKSYEAADATLEVRNLARAVLSVVVHTPEREIVLVQGEIEGATVLLNGSHSGLSLPSGLYAIRWPDEESFRELAVAKNVTTELELRDDERFPHGVRAVAIIDGIEEADPYAAAGTEGGVIEDGSADGGYVEDEDEVVYVDGGEPVWDGHAFIDVSTHTHGGGCGHWYYDRCWNLYPEHHTYTQPGYSSCGDTGGFYYAGNPWARVWDGLAFLFLRGHVHGGGCGHFYHHGCWNSFTSHTAFHEPGRGHFNACPPRSRVAVSRSRGGSGSSRRAESHGSPENRQRGGQQPQRVGESARREETQRRGQSQSHSQPQRVERAPKQQPTQRVEQAPRRQPAQRVELAPRRQPTQRVEQAPRRQPAQRVEQAPRHQPTQRAEQAPRRQPTQRAEQAPRRQPTQRVEQAPRHQPERERREKKR